MVIAIESPQGDHAADHPAMRPKIGSRMNVGPNIAKKPRANAGTT
jgi:hypothetical protein